MPKLSGLKLWLVGFSLAFVGFLIARFSDFRVGYTVLALGIALGLGGMMWQLVLVLKHRRENNQQ